MKKILVNAGLLPEQLEVLKKKLEIKISEKEEEKQNLLKEILETKTSEKTGINGDRCDRAFEQSSEDILQKKKKIRENEDFIKKCKMAIQRIDAGTYGYDIETGEPIPIARLLLVPHTTKNVSTKACEGSTVCQHRQFA